MSISEIEPCRIDFWQSVGIGIGFLLKCRFSVGIGFGIEKVLRFFWYFVGFSVFSEKLCFVALTAMLPYSVW
jgi:hypothetical protein